MPVGNIFSIPKKETINASLQSKSILIVGKSKTGKSTICAQAPRPVFLATENGTEMLTGMTNVPIASWSDFKNSVTQLCGPQGRENFDTVVVDTYTNLILLLDKYCGSKLSTEKTSFDFGSDADYGKGTKAMRSELGYQLQRLANCGYLILNIVHAEDKVDFETSKAYIGTSLSNSLFGVAEKFVDQIIYLRREEKPSKDGTFEYRTYFNATGGFAGTGGRLSPEEDYVPTDFKSIEAALLKAMQKVGATTGASLIQSSKPSVVIEAKEESFDDLMSVFVSITNDLVEKDPGNAAKIKATVEGILGGGKKVSGLNSTQGELLSDIINNLKATFAIN